MSALDGEIRRALHEAADRIEPVGVTDLAAALRDRRDAPAVRTADPGVPARPNRPGRAWLVAAAAVVVVGAAVAIERARQDGGTPPASIVQVDVGPGPDTAEGVEGGEPVGFEALEPGWHALDTGPVPAGTATSLTWTGTHLVVAGAGSAHLYDPAAGRWSALTLPPALGTSAASVAWTGDDLVFVTRNDAFSGPSRSAAWNVEDDAWRDLGPVPVAPAVQGAVATVGGGGGLYGPDGNVGLIWTGTRLLDLSHGAVLDPTEGSWTELAMPDDLVPYSALLYSTPVWTGHEAVWVAWSTSSGLAWSADGSTFREVPGLPPDLFGPHNVIPDATATSLGSDVLVLANVHDATAANPPTEPEERPAAVLLDPETGTWTRFEAPEAMAGEPWCWPRSATVGSETVVVSTRCEGVDPDALVDGRWTATSIPADARPCCAGTWAVAGDALVVWESDTDTYNNPEAPYVRARV